MPASNCYFVVILAAAVLQTGFSQSPLGTGCGQNKTCFFQPNNCLNTPGSYIDNTRCVVGATIQDINDGNAVIELFSFIGYMDGVDISMYGIFMAFGFSYDIWMGDDSVMNCVWSPKHDNPELTLSYNTGHSHGGNYNKDNVFDSSTSVVNNTFRCKFTRKIVATSSTQYVYPLNAPYYFQITRGPADAITMSPHVHSLSDSDNFPFVSTEKYYPIGSGTSKYSDAVGNHGWASTISRTMQYQLVYAHGGLMMLGFWVFIGTGILLGRYYKAFFPVNPTIGKSAAWFQVHRGIQVTGALMVITSFICIFVSTGHLVNKDMGQVYQHMIMGITAVILIVLLPIGAIFRPHVDSPYRPLFKDFHFFGAFSAMALAFGCFILAATDISKGGMTGDTNCLTCMYAVVGIFGFVNVFQTIYMRLYQASKEKKDSTALYSKISITFEKTRFCLPWTWGLHTLTAIYILSTLGISIYLITVQVNYGVPTLADKFPLTNSSSQI